MRSRLILFGAWLLAAVGVIAYAATQRIYIGRMVLPREQVVALAISAVVAATTVGLWLALGVRAVGRALGLGRGRGWLDRPAVRAGLLLLLVVDGALLAYARFVEPSWLIVREVPIGEPPPHGQGPVRLAVISDLHLDRWRPPFRDLAARINAARPDVVLLLGDTLNRRSALKQLHTILGEIRAPHGKFAVRGNWESWYWHRLPLLEGTGFVWLERDARTLKLRGQTVHLVGFPYQDQDEGKLAEQRLAALPDEEWRVFLYHTPDLMEQVPSADLYLAGHTHGGQVAIPGFGALVTLSRFGKRFERGLSRVGRTTLYVTPGIGIEPMVPYRLGVRPEVTLILLGSRERGRWSPGSTSSKSSAW